MLIFCPPFLLGFLSFLCFASGIVCPPEMLKAAPVGLPAGSTCGGTCHAHGHCAAGLSCKQPHALIPVLGVQAAGVCVQSLTSADEDFESTAVKQTVKEALMLLNAQSSLC